MRNKNCLFTSESVTEGHPDKVADQISDAVLDAIYKEDPQGRVACETFVSMGLTLVGGQITTDCYVDIPGIVRETIRDIGYIDPVYGFDYQTCAVLINIEQQSPDIALGVDRGGAGDQGIMFGYAANETAELMPMPILLAHKLAMRLTEVRKDKTLPYLRPDGKTQVTVEYENGNPVRLDTVVIGAHHDPIDDIEKLREDIIETVIVPIVPEGLIDRNNVKYHINATGKFEIGGPMADTGLTGRKIIVDTYGGVGSHGGGCFSGKDPTKVDRSGSYMARYAAKNVVAAGLAERCEIQLGYCIGVAEPVSITIDTQGTGVISDKEIEKKVREHFDFRPRAMIDHLQLKRPIFKKTAAYGHFGREEKEFTWEARDKVEDLKKG